MVMEPNRSACGTEFPGSYMPQDIWSSSSRRHSITFADCSTCLPCTECGQGCPPGRVVGPPSRRGSLPPTTSRTARSSTSGAMQLGGPHQDIVMVILGVVGPPKPPHTSHDASRRLLKDKLNLHLIYILLIWHSCIFPFFLSLFVKILNERSLSHSQILGTTTPAWAGSGAWWVRRWWWWSYMNTLPIK